MKNIIIIGSGKRVQHTILPALACLPQKVFITDILGKSSKTISSPFGKLKVRPIEDLPSIDTELTDTIIIAITTEHVPTVLKTLSHMDVKRITLFLDTPVFLPNHIYAKSYVTKFKNVYVTEDIVKLSLLTIAKNVILQNKIGEIRHIILWHSGYRHHALAFLRRLLSQPYIRRIRRKKYNDSVAETFITFPNGITAAILEPRDYSVGRLLIIGEKGAIANYPLTTDNSIEIKIIVKNKSYQGVSVTNTEQTYLFKKPNNSDFNSVFMANDTMGMMKIEALACLFTSYMYDKHEELYSLGDGLYDMMATYAVQKYSHFFDIKLPFTNTSLVQAVLTKNTQPAKR